MPKAASEVENMRGTWHQIKIRQSENNTCVNPIVGHNHLTMKQEIIEAVAIYNKRLADHNEHGERVDAMYAALQDKRKGKVKTAPTSEEYEHAWRAYNNEEDAIKRFDRRGLLDACLSVGLSARFETGLFIAIG